MTMKNWVLMECNRWFILFRWIDKEMYSIMQQWRMMIFSQIKIVDLDQPSQIILRNGWGITIVILELLEILAWLLENVRSIIWRIIFRERSYREEMKMAKFIVDYYEIYSKSYEVEASSKRRSGRNCKEWYYRR